MNATQKTNPEAIVNCSHAGCNWRGPAEQTLCFGKNHFCQIEHYLLYTRQQEKANTSFVGVDDHLKKPGTHEAFHRGAL